MPAQVQQMSDYRAASAAPQQVQIGITEITSGDERFLEAYKVLTADIAPEYVETPDFLRNRLSIREQMMQGSYTPQSEEDARIAQAFNAGYNLTFKVAYRQDTGEIIGGELKSLVPLMGTKDAALEFGSYGATKEAYRGHGINSALSKAASEALENYANAIGRNIIAVVGETERDNQYNTLDISASKGLRVLDLDYYQYNEADPSKPAKLEFLVKFNGEAPGVIEQNRVNAGFVDLMLRSIIELEYIEKPEESVAYQLTRKSMEGREFIGYRTEATSETEEQKAA